jgi:hypothetical protein
VGEGNGYQRHRLVGHIIKLLGLAVGVLGSEQRFAWLALGYPRKSGLLGGVLVGVQRQYPCLRQQRPHKAEQEQQSKVGAKKGPQHSNAKTTD